MRNHHLLTSSEVAAFTGLDERSVRKDVEHGIIGAASPPRFVFPAMVYFRARALLGLTLGTDDRRRLYQLIVEAVRDGRHTVHLGPITELHLGGVEKELHERLDRFAAWKRTLSEHDAVLGGEPTFPKSRLAVRQVGSMLLRGASADDVREDYPYLDDRDLEFAKLYTLAYPRLGRPPGPP